MVSKKSDTSTIAALAIIGAIVVLVSLAIFVTAVVFAIVNGIALFGPDGDITSVWHWVWFVICSVVILGNIFNRTR
jgi:hypothetical protein